MLNGKKIRAQEHTIAYELRRSARKTLSLEIREDGSLLVRAPKSCEKSRIEAFIREKEDWIREKSEAQKRRERKAEEGPKLTDAQRQLYRERSREVFEQKTAYYARIMGVSYERIAIRDQKTRWGSCSAKKNLNFNWRLILAPAGVLDYVVVHELAHLREMNHSARFWAVVEETMPDYRKYRSWLRENGRILQNM